MQLTNENYYSKESDEEYLSHHSLMNYIGNGLGISGCEAKAEAIRKGEWQTEETDAMVIGSYVDAFFDSEEEFEKFKHEHPEIISSRGATKGQLKSTFIMADKMIERAKKDKLFMKTMQGESQKIVIGEIEGARFKGRIDKYQEGRCIVDLKTAKDDIHRAYRTADGTFVSFVEYWGYDIQLAIYQELVYQMTGDRLPVYLSIITKSDNPEICVVGIPQEVLDERLKYVKGNVHQVMRIRKEEVEPIRCEKCDYCRATKVLDRVISIYDLIK